jgi:hypothetical protein
MTANTELRKWLVTTALSVAVAALSWSAIELSTGSRTRFEPVENIMRLELNPAVRQSSRSVEFLKAVSNVHRGNIASLERLTALITTLSKKASETSGPSAGQRDRILGDSIAAIATRAAHDALLDSATYAAMRARRLTDSDRVLLAAAERLMHAQAVGWLSEAAVWRGWNGASDPRKDSAYVASEAQLDIATRGYNATYAQAEKNRAEDFKQYDEISARYKEELEKAHSRFLIAAICFGVSSIVLVMALSRALSDRRANTDKERDADSDR